MRDIVNNLQEFGLTDKEAMIFYALSKLGVSTTSEIRSSINFSPVQTHRGLKGLQEKGLIEVSITKPKRFTAVELDSALDILEKDSKQKIIEMENRKKLLINEWIKIPERRASSNTPTLKVIRGERNIINFKLKLFEQSKHNVDTVLSNDQLSKSDFDGISDILSMKNKKKVRILSEIDDGNFNAATHFRNCELRHLSKLDLTQFAIIDNSEVLVHLSDKSQSALDENSSVIWTNYHNYVSTMQFFFEMLWVTATPVNNRRGEQYSSAHT